jgi:hypothetical protein
MSHLSPVDMIFYKEGDNIMSGGFSIDSLLLHNGVSPMYTNNLTGGNSSNAVGDIFKNLAIPTGLLYQKNGGKKRDLFKYTEHAEELQGGFKNNTVLPEDIHAKLLKMIEVNDSGKTTRERKTRKHRVSKESKEKGKKNNSRRI